jgi:hypothetical protein
MSHVRRARWLTGNGLHLLFPEQPSHTRYDNSLR